ncbi:Cation/H+ exchanger, partial [Rhodocollybia butyracea]
QIYLNEVVLGTAFGIIIGPHAANILDPRSWSSSLEDQNNITLEVMRIILGVGLFIIGVELPKNYMWKHGRSLLAMVIPTMAFGWLLVGGILKLLFPSLTFVSCLVIAACLTPTDPIICSAIVGGKFAKEHVHIKLRQILSAESAANDGLAYPFLSISIYLTVESSKRVAFGKWFLIGWLYQVILGVVLGAIMGCLFSYFFQFLERGKRHVDRESYVAQYIAMALFTVGLAHTIGSDDLLAAFAAGTALSWDGHFTKRTNDKQIDDKYANGDKQFEEAEKETFVSVIELVLNCAGFIYIGTWLPFQSFNTPDLGIVPWKLVVLCICTLLLRRIPPLMLLSYCVPEIGTWKKALFSGHFGMRSRLIMGVGAVYISTLALTELSTPHDPPQNQEELLALYIQPVVAFLVLGSIIIRSYLRYLITLTWFAHIFLQMVFPFRPTLYGASFSYLFSENSPVRHGPCSLKNQLLTLSLFPLLTLKEPLVNSPPITLRLLIIGTTLPLQRTASEVMIL